MGNIKTVERFITSDNEEFDNIKQAKIHQLSIDMNKKFSKKQTEYWDLILDDSDITIFFENLYSNRQHLIEFFRERDELNGI